MEPIKLTKEKINMVRGLEGFPISRDEDIIALSDVPFFTECPNPFVEEFIATKGTPYIEATDTYRCEPFTADVSEGKGDAIYNSHMYHTKVPYKAIMRYILHYTKPGDVIFDGFCGSGMTGVAAQMCEAADLSTRASIESTQKNVQWGARNAILNDLSPAAAFIAYNCNMPVDAAAYHKEMEEILAKSMEKCAWMYETNHEAEGQMKLFEGECRKGTINYIVWSEVLICPHCGEENVFWDMAWANEGKKVQTVYHCSHCGSEIIKRSCSIAIETVYDNLIGKPVQLVKFVPVQVVYEFEGKRYEKIPDAADLELIEKINAMDVPVWVPTI